MGTQEPGAKGCEEADGSFHGMSENSVYTIPCGEMATVDIELSHAHSVLQRSPTLTLRRAVSDRTPQIALGSLSCFVGQTKLSLNPTVSLGGILYIQPSVH